MSLLLFLLNLVQLVFDLAYLINLNLHFLSESIVLSLLSLILSLK